MKYANYDGLTGEILGYYDDTIHATIPETSVPLTDAEWQDCIDNNGLRRIDPATGTVVVYTPPPPALSDYIADACAAIDAHAGAIRDSYVSPGSLVEQEYTRALQVATEWQAAGEPAGAVPSAVQSWADAGGMTPSVAAANIVATAAGMNAALDAIRAARLAGKAAVSAAADHAAVDTAKAAAIASLDALTAQ